MCLTRSSNGHIYYYLFHTPSHLTCLDSEWQAKDCNTLTQTIGQLLEQEPRRFSCFNAPSPQRQNRIIHVSLGPIVAGC